MTQQQVDVEPGDQIEIVQGDQVTRITVPSGVKKAVISFYEGGSAESPSRTHGGAGGSSSPAMCSDGQVVASATGGACVDGGFIRREDGGEETKS